MLCKVREGAWYALKIKGLKILPTQKAKVFRLQLIPTVQVFQIYKLPPFFFIADCDLTCYPIKVNKTHIAVPVLQVRTQSLWQLCLAVNLTSEIN